MNKNYEITTRADIAEALFAVDSSLHITLHRKWYRIGNNFLNNISAVEREDGSGKRFNVTGYNSQNKKQTFFVEVVD